VKKWAANPAKSARLPRQQAVIAEHGKTLPPPTSLPEATARCFHAVLVSRQACAFKAKGIAMESNLRPLTLGEILDRTAQLYRSHFWLFAGIASVYSGVILLLNLMQLGVHEFLRAGSLARYVKLSDGIGLLIQLFVAFVLGGLAMAANNRAVGWVHLGEPATIRVAYTSILPRTGRYVWLMTIVTFMMWLPLALAYAGYLGVIFLWIRPVLPKGGLSGLSGSNPAPVDQQAMLIVGLVTLLFVAVCLGCLAYAIVMGLRYSLAVAASVVEDLKARQAIRRSVNLSKGSRGRIFVLALLVIVIQTGLVLITQMVFIVMTFRHGELSAGARILQQLVAFATNTFIGPIYATGFTLFYYDQRVRKEGYDIEWMMQAAGLTQPPELPGTPPPPATEALETSNAPTSPDQTEHA
jgi:hypothetical protein